MPNRKRPTVFLRAASLLPLASRDAFISEVDSRLCSVRRQLTDADVSAAIVSTLTVLNVTTSSHLLCELAKAAKGVIMPIQSYEATDRDGKRGVRSDWPLGVSLAARRPETISACLAHRNKSLAQTNKSPDGNKLLRV